MINGVSDLIPVKYLIVVKRMQRPTISNTCRAKHNSYWPGSVMQCLSLNRNKFNACMYLEHKAEEQSFGEVIIKFIIKYIYKKLTIKYIIIYTHSRAYIDIYFVYTVRYVYKKT